ncbi:MAG: flagellar protein FlaG [Tissierellia bacterium]|nr:flagellar protein FlaG [Tissierellia bacterium]
MGKGGLGMQIDGVTNCRYNEANRNIPNPIKSGIRDQNVKSAEQLEQKRYTEDELIRSIESANKQFVAYDRRFEFSIHEKTKHIMVKVIDVTTDEIIREIPPEKILDLVAAIWEISGIIVDERV